MGAVPSTLNNEKAMKRIFLFSIIGVVAVLSSGCAVTVRSRPAVVYYEPAPPPPPVVVYEPAPPPAVIVTPAPPPRVIVRPAPRPPHCHRWHHGHCHHWHR